MSPTVRAAGLVAALALSALHFPPQVIALCWLALATATVVDALAARNPPAVIRKVPHVLSRGVSESLTIESSGPQPSAVVYRQPVPPDIDIDPPEADGALRATILPRRRGRHVLPAPAARCEGPLGLGRWYHRPGEDGEVLVYPDLPAARKLALAVRRGRLGHPGHATRGPLGLGTDFESIRDYLPDDDIRQVNWRATERLGRPMSNQYRVEQDREVMCVLDTGRLMGAPLGELTRLDAALDAVTAVALVADELGDRCGALAFDSKVRRHIRPRRGGGEAVIEALFDLEPVRRESDYELAFRTVGHIKRAFVLVLTDLLEESAARPLVEAIPILARRHAVAVASVTDPDLSAAVANPPQAPIDVYAAAVALDVLDARARVSSQLRHAGADVIETSREKLGAACVLTYLKAKARARL